MTVTVSGRLGEGKTCIANIVREALGMRGISVDMGIVKFLEADAAESLFQKKIVVKIVEVEES